MNKLIVSAFLIAIAGCSSDSNNNSTLATSAEYRIKLVNLTHGQPFSPPLALLHNGEFKAWEIGTPASIALEKLAEGGDAGELLASQDGKPNHISDSPLAPGQGISFSMTADSSDHQRLTLATMLVNSNDVFSGISGLDLAAMEAGETRIVNVGAYDSGTEGNSEAVGTMPGPADGGEGFNASRDDIADQVTHHGGVVSRDDGLPDSVLSDAHRFDNPVMRIEITRI